MRLEHEGRVAASRERVWAILMDVPRAARLVPGLASVEAIGPDRYRGSLRVQVGPVRLDLAGNVEVAARDEAAGTATMRLDAADPRLGGAVRATLDLALTEVDASTTAVRMVTEAQVLGRIGELGQPVIRRKADQTMKAFFAELSRAAATP